MDLWAETSKSHPLFQFSFTYSIALFNQIMLEKWDRIYVETIWTLAYEASLTNGIRCDTFLCTSTF